MQDKSKVHLAAAIVASLGLAMHVPAEARQLDRDAFKVGGARSLNSKAALAQALTDDSSNKGVEAGCKGKEGSCKGKEGSCKGKEGSCKGKEGSCKGKEGSCKGKEGSCKG
ncbi:MAG TPA: hypothetical protein PL112_25000, partial [Candidatus Obscuribacter sp.]|nr:hypothetical protein [Candidatus Obscuribacter sp.]